MSRRVAVVLPAFNEAAGIETLLWRIARALENLEYLVLVVDDGSTDETAGIVERLSDRLPVRLIRHIRNSGYGAAIRTGLLAARHQADVVVTMDADDSHDPSLIPLMIHGIACGSDVIVASRFVPGGREVGVPYHRRALSRGAAVVFSRLLDVANIHDYTSGYRAYRAEFLDGLVDVLGETAFVRETGFTVGVELLLKADRACARLAEVPLVLRYDRKRSASKLKIRETMHDYARLLANLRDESGGASASERDRRSMADRLKLGDGVVPTATADVLAVFASFTVSFFVYGWLVNAGIVQQGYPETGRYALLACMFAATTAFSFWRFGLYVPRLTVHHLRHLQLVGEALTGSVLLFFALLFFASGSHPSRLLVFGAIGLSYPIMLVARRLVTGWLRQRRLEQRRTGRALIYGAGLTGRLLMKKILEAPRIGTSVAGFLDDLQSVGTEVPHRLSQVDGDEIAVEVLGMGRDLARVATETGATELYLAVPDMTDARIASIRAEAEILGLDFGIVPRIGTVRADQLTVEELGAIPVLRLHRRNPHHLHGFSKRVLDLGLLLILLPLAVPLALITAAVIRLEGRPVLFRQTRIGLNGRPFTLIKFRTMHPDVEPYSASPASNDDRRITRVGKLVRMSGLDELPQLINVFRGEMSLVGPRPEMPHIVAGYGELERQRLTVRPGISGLWQLSPDRSQAIHDNLEYDLYYLRQQRLSFDLLILLETALFVIGAVARSIRLGATAARRVVVDKQSGRSSKVRKVRDDSEDVVLVALDQRQRPDEPPSWSQIMPSVSMLGRDCRVRVLVADRNSPRVRELVESSLACQSRLEYVSYRDGTNVQALTDAAHVVVTDVQHLADVAASSGRAVVMVEGSTVHTPSGTGGRVALAERVRAALGGPESGLRMAH